METLTTQSRKTRPHKLPAEQSPSYVINNSVVIVAETYNGSIANNGSAASLSGEACIGINAKEHDELIRLQIENQYLRMMASAHKATIAENSSLINYLLNR